MFGTVLRQISLTLKTMSMKRARHRGASLFLVLRLLTTVKDFEKAYNLKKGLLFHHDKQHFVNSCFEKGCLTNGNKRGKADATMSKVITGNDCFYGCLIEPKGVSAWWKETPKTHVFRLSRSLLLNHLEPQSSKAKLLLLIMPIDILA